MKKKESRISQEQKEMLKILDWDLESLRQEYEMPVNWFKLQALAKNSDVKHAINSLMGKWEKCLKAMGELPYTQVQDSDSSNNNGDDKIIRIDGKPFKQDRKIIEEIITEMESDPVIFESLYSFYVTHFKLKSKEG